MHDKGVDWEQIYLRLEVDRHDAEAWQALEQRVRVWLRADELTAADVLDDAVAEVLAAVFASFERARGPDTFRGFVHGHRLNVRRRMRSALRAPLISLESMEDMPLAAHDIVRQHELEELDEALDRLPWREQEALMLRYFRGLQPGQIAEVLGVSQVNARQIVFQGLARLRRYFTPRGLANRAA